jgi:methyl-accepting chemotaxis protein
MSDINKVLIGLSGTDLARLAIPKIPDYNKILFGGSMMTQINLMNKKAKQLTAAHQIALSGITPRMTELAWIIEKQYKPSISAFQSISDKLRPLILQQSKIAEQFKNIAAISNPTLEAIKTLSSFNAFGRYRETFDEFGGFIDPESVTAEEIEQTINENKELISDVNTIVLNAKIEGVSPGDVPGLIYSFLRNKIPFINERTYGIIVLIFSTIIFTYGLYSNYTTNSGIDNDIIPTLNDNSEKLENIKEDTEEIKDSMHDFSEKMENVESNVEDIKDSFNDLKEDVVEFMDETNDKLDLLYQEMKKQKKKNK